MTPLHPRGGLCAACLPVALADGQLKLTALPHRRRRLHTHCRRASATLSSRVALQRPRHTQIPPCTSRGRHRRAQPPSARLVVCSARPRFPGRQPRPGLRPRHRRMTSSAEMCGTAPCSMQWSNEARDRAHGRPNGTIVRDEHSTEPPHCATAMHPGGAPKHGRGTTPPPSQRETRTRTRWQSHRTDGLWQNEGRGGGCVGPTVPCRFKQ